MEGGGCKFGPASKQLNFIVVSSVGKDLGKAPRRGLRKGGASNRRRIVPTNPTPVKSTEPKKPTPTKPQK